MDFHNTLQPIVIPVKHVLVKTGSRYRFHPARLSNGIPAFAGMTQVGHPYNADMGEASCLTLTAEFASCRASVTDWLRSVHRKSLAKFPRHHHSCR
ncbi:hypothetical protein V22_05770 [Calycomorphotria hydatis]|uniref:Uncharacterized protein n=1 Tax=Calycomorphotria hydatis TaxID=2528027 RepID=A0A517T4P2_9PLAN|nr:hypothetical protein V22_05770 [Calycomorphotria hydatis]